MSVIDTLIYDRTQSDVDRWSALAGKNFAELTADERAEWISGMKGAYNAADLDRVGEALIYLQDKLNGYGYAVTVDAKTDFNVADTPTKQQMERYLSNVAAIRSALSVFYSTPDVPSTMEKLTLEKANDIEKILLDVDALLTLMTGSFLRCGAAGVACGARGLPTEGGYVVRTWAELDDTGWGWPEWDTKTWTELSYRKV